MNVEEVYWALQAERSGIATRHQFTTAGPRLMYAIL